jgi:hypothetical protein
MKTGIAAGFISLAFVLSIISSAKAESTDYSLELSFGNSLLFLDQGYVGDSGQTEKKTLPVSSYLFLSEYRISRLFSFAGAWNIPITTVKRVKGTSITEKYVAPAYGFGPTCRIVTINLWSQTYLEPEVAMLLFRTYHSASSKGNIFYPVSVFKLNIFRESGMNIYAGVSQAPAKNTTAFIYGIGQRF